VKIAVLNDVAGDEARVSATPDTIKTYVDAGHSVSVVKGAGKGANISDQDYKDAGASLAASNTAAAKAADLVLTLGAGSPAIAKAMKAGSGIAGVMNPTDHPKLIEAYAKAKVAAIALDWIPRISRAQSMDVLSSQSNLAGYRSVIEASNQYGRAFPMMMTAAGTVAPAKTFIMGAGVAGLQAIATARRLGAVTTATDVRPAAKEQVASLGAKFIAVENEEFKAAETAGGYAKQMSAEYQALQAELTAKHVAKQDIVITTALIPGRPAPQLISKDMIATMKPGSVIVDLAAERGGNVEGITPGKVTTTSNGVTLVALTNWPSRMAADASNLFARNIKALMPLLVAEDGTFTPDWEDDILKGSVLTRSGEIVNERLQGAMT
jgi:NAD(P) transhydrogenase subunit alpha